MEIGDRILDSRRFLRMLALVVIAPSCLALLLVAARHDTARSGMAREQSASVPDAISQPAGVGPDWAVVQDYFDLQSAWRERTSGIAMAGLSAEERNRRLQDAFAERPDIRPAIAAATAIVDVGATHDRTTEAAEFLVMQTFTEPDADRHISRERRCSSRGRRTTTAGRRS